MTSYSNIGYNVVVICSDKRSSVAVGIRTGDRQKAVDERKITGVKVFK